MCCGLGNVYTTNRSFRSEHSSTSKHLSEFTHLEIEMNNVEMKDVMDIGEKYIKWMIRSVWFHNKEDLDFLSKTPFNKGLLETYKQLQTLQFYRVTYDEIYKKISEMKEEVEYSYMDIPDFCYGDDLSSELEKFIVNLYGGAVFVTNWPKNIKSFYMRIDRKNPELVENFDLLMPFGVGELIGGSMREEQLELLTENMKAKEVSQKGLEWYLDLRKYGTCKHGGFGLGMERLMMMLTGVSNIRDVIPYPNSYETCYY
jgi:asparaginyl-tRNA synthetase